MNAAASNELMFEILKDIQRNVALLREDTHGIKSRLTSVDTRLGLVHTDMAHLSDRMDKLESRLSRVENRLNFGEQQQ